MLLYIHQARDASEHGDTVLGHDTVVKPKAMGVNVLVTPEALATGSGHVGAMMSIPTLLLLPVTSRGRTYTLPTKHLGQSMHPSIEVVAEATLAYLADLVMEAKSRAV